MWVELYPDVLEEMGLATWEELRPYAHEEPQAIGGAFRALIATKAEGDQSRLMSEPSATQLGRLISELARSNTGTRSPGSIGGEVGHHWAVWKDRVRADSGYSQAGCVQLDEE